MSGKVTKSQKPADAKRGRRVGVLKLEGDWKQNIAKSFQNAKKPAAGSPKQ